MSQSTAAAMQEQSQVKGSAPRRSNLRLALILASIAAVFFAGVIAKYLLLR